MHTSEGERNMEFDGDGQRQAEQWHRDDPWRPTRQANIKLRCARWSQASDSPQSRGGSWLLRNSYDLLTLSAAQLDQ